MEEKLQELTNKIYTEGVEKARKEAEEILAKAREEADRMLAEARHETERLRERAKEEAEELRRNTTSELQLSARQAVSGLKQQIAGLVTTQLLSKPVREAVSDKDFLKRIIETAIKNWNPAGDGSPDLRLLLPEKERETAGKYFESHAKELLQGGLHVAYDDRLSDGFRIGPADGSFVISFTAEDFERFFRTYLRPQVDQLLYE
jgi:V/A-type H+/Na+-transporting ATPase subunit E